MFLITLHPGQLPVDVAGLHLVPGKATPVDTVPPEVEALRPRVKMSITKTRPVDLDDGPERAPAPDLDGDGVPDAPTDDPAPAQTETVKRRKA